MAAPVEELGRYVAGLSATEAQRDRLGLHVVDSLAAWIASTATEEGKRLRRLRARLQESKADAGLGLDLAIRSALARLSEIDDIHLASMTTPGGIVVPAVLTLAGAWGQSTAHDINAAILAGYEVMTRLGRAIDGPAVLYRGVWPTYFATPMAVAAAAARLLKLDAQASGNALALALTFSAPAVGHANARSTARWLSVGNAARNGLAAALAAKEGFTADGTLLDAASFKAARGLDLDTGALTAGLGGGSVLAEISFKPWCAARQTMAATQALIEIIDAGVAAAAIDEITAWVLPPHRNMIDHGVSAGDRASFLTSLQYQMAQAALASDRAFALAATSEPSATIRELMQKITVHADERLLADYPRSWPAHVSVVAAGSRHERTVTDVPGDPARAFERSAVERKFVRFVGPVVGTARAEHLLAQVSHAVRCGDYVDLLGEIERS